MRDWMQSDIYISLSKIKIKAITVSTSSNILTLQIQQKFVVFAVLEYYNTSIKVFYKIQNNINYVI